VAALPWNQRQLSSGIGGSFAVESVAGFPWNRWQFWRGIRSPTYRATYHEFLKIDFPRIPFVDNQETFEVLSELGWALLQAHVLRTIPAEPKVDVTKGSIAVEKPVYEDKQQRLYINTEQYFSPVPRDVWEFHIGGYQVLDKYLKSRKGRTLILDEIENIQNVVQILTFTIQHMQKIDECWQP
jgi:hypothetical protein